MSTMTRRSVAAPVVLTAARARALWLNAQRLDQDAPFGAGPEAVARAIAHLGYVQIDTINVIERCHHHILWSRIPDYRRADLTHAQSEAKSVFEYWTHALAYVPTADIRYFLPAMRAYRLSEQTRWFGTVTPADTRKVMRLLKTEGPQSIRDIDDDDLVEKTHPWASKKPSKKALQLAFYCGDVAIAAREGMIKRYDLMDRHFGWSTRPKAASVTEILTYKLDRALKAQALVSLDSICHLDAASKPAVHRLIEARVKALKLVPVEIAGGDGVLHWAAPETVEASLERPTGDEQSEPRVHLLSPFDPLIIQRKRLKRFFGYDHLFEAYVPKDKRRLGYFALPVLIGDRIAAAIDIKADRQAGRLLIQQWTWTAEAKRRDDKRLIEAAFDRFAAFQFAQA
jgi:uncharacterized protein